MKIDSDKSHAVLIDKETGKVHDLGEVTVTKLDGGPLLPDDVLPKDFDAQKSYTWTLKLSKRKGRKFEYAMKRLCMPPKRKYISKREILDRIYSDYVDKGFARPLWPKEEFMRLTHKSLLAIYTDLCKAYRKWLEYHGAPDEGGYGAGQLDKIPVDKPI